MINLEKELNQSRQEKMDEQEAIVDVSKALLESNAQNEIQIIRTLGIDKNLTRADDAKGVNLERTNLEGKYGGYVFTEEEIMNLCIQYRLRFLPAKNYVGVVDSSLGPKLREFNDKHNLGMENHAGNNDNFKLMAPATHFSLTKKIKPKITFQTDPLLFYKVDQNNDNTYYKLIHKWGNDFTIMRYIYSFMFRTPVHYFFTLWFYIALAIFAIGGFASWGITALILIPTLVGGVISLLLLWGSLADETEWVAFSDKYWDSDLKV